MRLENPAAQIQVGFVALLAAAAWVRPLQRPRQFTVTALALFTVGAVLLAHFSRGWLSSFAYSILWDWLPVPLLLVPYWQVGQFITDTDPKMERRLAAFDGAFFRALGIEPGKISISVWVAGYLELAYLVVYPVVPLGLVALYVAGLRSYVSYYWIVVLTATYLCFAITPFVRAMPPRVLSDYENFKVPTSQVAAVNGFILRRGSIKAITFPSGHVSSALAAALVLLRLDPWVGLIFLIVALSIAVATVVGGYHYAADVLSASVIALVVFAGTFWMS